MENRKVILVTGGTGNQGGAVAINLLKQGKWKVKVLSRNQESVKSKILKSEGIDVVAGNLNDPKSYSEYLNKIYGIFSVQNFTNGIDKEIEQGKTITELAKIKGVKHLIYSSVSGTDLKSGIPHFESKNIIEKHIKNTGVPFTIIRPTSFYENLLNPEVKKRILKGKLVMPINKDVRQEFISLQDIGIIVGQIFNNPSKYLGKTITIASDKMTMEDLSKLLSKTMNKEIKYEKLPKFITRLVMGKNLYKMFNWVNKERPEFVSDIEALRKEFMGMTNLESWLKEEFK